MKKLVSLFSIVCFSTSAFATDLPACRAAYGKSFAKDRTSTLRAAYLRNFVSGVFLGGAVAHGGEYLLPKILGRTPATYSPRDIKVATVVGGTLAVIAFSSHIARQAMYYNMNFSEIVAHAIDEANSNQSGPATQSLIEYVNLLMAKKSIFQRFNIFANLDVPKPVTDLLSQSLGNQAPTAERVQDAIRWMTNLGLLCYADNSALVPTDFTSRFAYALGQVGPASK